MKKFLAIILTLTLALSLSVTAFAADKTIGPDNNGDPYPSTADTTVQFNVDPTYTVTIPAIVKLEKNSANGTYEQNAEIVASKVRLRNGQTIQVTLSAGTGDTAFVLISGENATLDYTVTVGESENATPISSGNIVATFGSSTEKQTSTLHFAAADPTYAGDYSDTVVFNIAIGNQTSTNP